MLPTHDFTTARCIKDLKKCKNKSSLDHIGNLLDQPIISEWPDYQNLPDKYEHAIGDDQLLV